jgi:NADH-quinone oxidoreductase subunit C
MTAAEIIDLLNPLVPGGGLEVGASVDMPVIYVPADRLVATALALRDNPALRFEVLIEITAADYLPREPRFEVVYLLLSVSNRLRLRLKVRVAGSAAAEGVLPTLQQVWPAAGWPEREVYDMFGIVFSDHPDLRRILMPDDWDGHPARKDYPVQIRKAVQTYEPMEITSEEFAANLERDRLRRSTH